MSRVAYFRGHCGKHEYDEARTCFEEAMRLNREVGDAWMVAISDNNLGNATRGLGDFSAARHHYAESLRAYREYDDKWALAERRYFSAERLRSARPPVTPPATMAAPPTPSTT